MRLYAPSWALCRQSIKGTSVGGYDIPPGSLVLMSQYVTHRDSRFYPDPNAFRPERWNAEMKSKLPVFAFFPFGGGPLVCVGESLAWIECAVLLATIGQRWQMRHFGDHEVGLLPKVALRPRQGMMMKLKKRN